jgi:hypothetical protein
MDPGKLIEKADRLTKSFPTTKAQRPCIVTDWLITGKAC